MDGTTKKPKILYVEDDQGLASLYGARLVAEGYEVKYCFDGDKALQMGRDFRPDLILLDLMMPTLDGYGALEMFRGLLETSAAKIIVMSALGQPEDVNRAYSLGADDFVVKSQVLIDDVMLKIRKHLGLPLNEGSAQAPLAPTATPQAAVPNPAPQPPFNSNQN